MKHRRHIHCSYSHNLWKQRYQIKITFVRRIVECVGVTFQVLRIHSKPCFQLCLCIEWMYIVRLDCKKPVFAISVHLLLLGTIDRGTGKTG